MEMYVPATLKEKYQTPIVSYSMLFQGVLFVPSESGQQLCQFTLLWPKSIS